MKRALPGVVPHVPVAPARRRVALATCWLLASGSWLLPTPPARAEALPDGWPFRRQLTFKEMKSDAPGDNIAWAEFYTNGAHKPDGSDIRVTDLSRGVLPSRVLQASKDNDLVRIAFATRGDGPCSVWWGNDKPDKPAPPLDIKRGVLAQVHKFPGGAVPNQAALDKAFERAGPPVGALFLPEVFLGHNPLGEEWTAMIRYTAQFKIDRPGTFDLAFAVADCGYMLLDGKLISQHYNSHLPGHVRHPRAVELKAGWHTLEVTQVNANAGPTGVVVAWKTPAARGYTALPQSIFAPVSRALDGGMETIGKSYTADFGIVPEGEAFCPPNDYIQRYAFDARFPASFKPTFAWDFGDGQTSTLARPHHYFLTPGNYTVSLKLTHAGATFTAARRVTIKDRMYARFPSPPEDATKTVQAVLTTYKTDTLAGEAALRGMMFFKKHNDNDNYVAWGKAWLLARDATADKTYRDEVFDLSRMHQLRKEYKASADVYRLAADRQQLSMDLRLQMARLYVMTLVDYADDAPQAHKVAQEWLKKIPPGNKPHQQTALSAVVYAAIAMGDGKLAEKSAAESGARREQPYDKQQLRQGVLARNIETYIRTKEFDTATKLIDQWEWEFPEAACDGFTRLLRVKLLTAENRPEVAARAALSHARALPSGFYAAELLYRASELYKTLGETEKSRAALDLLKTKYPESPYANDKPKPD